MDPSKDYQEKEKTTEEKRKSMQEGNISFSNEVSKIPGTNPPPDKPKTPPKQPRTQQYD